MSWLRSSPLRQSLTRSTSNSTASNMSTNVALRPRANDTSAAARECDPRACYDSFCKHWLQANDIIQRSQPGLGNHKNSIHDDVLAVVSHLDFMVTLLLVELHHCNKISLLNGENTTTATTTSTSASSPSSTTSLPPSLAPCLEFMLSENLLDKLFEWGITTGRYANAVRLEQLKLYELLVSHSRHQQLLCHESFLRPLLKVLASSQDEIFPPDLEKRLVILLNQLCVVLMQNVHLLDLFFFTEAAQEQNAERGRGSGTLKESRRSMDNSPSSTNFIIFSLLIPYVHREGSLGHQARDALLLCMSLSQKNTNIGTYIAQYSSLCPLLVTGLGGLYSRLPNSIEVTSGDWHRITTDDVTEISELMLFMNALEFCNAVVQVAHDSIKQQLLDFMYQGFIVPVLGPAILQTLNGQTFQTNIDSQISAMCYLDLMLRSVTEPELMHLFVKFLLDAEKFDGERLLDTLIERLKSTDSHLCIVTMALFDTLIGLGSEDIMLELVLKYLLPVKHVPLTQRYKINQIDANTFDFFLSVTPDVMKRAHELTKHKYVAETVNAKNVGEQQTAPSLPSPISSMSKTIGANWNYYTLHKGESLYGNFYAYLMEARYKTEQYGRACAKWNNSYKYQMWPLKSQTPRPINVHTMQLIKEFFDELNNVDNNETSHSTPTHITPAYINPLDDSGAEKNKMDSLQSIGDSSGYESFKWRSVETDDANHDDDGNDRAGTGAEEDEGASKPNWNISTRDPIDLSLNDFDFSDDLFTPETVTLGPFLNALWNKLQNFTSNTLYVNLHLTGLITHFAWYPLPLLHTILLHPDIIISADIPSFQEVLRVLKQQIDAELPVTEESLELIDVARSNLIDRELRLINVRNPSAMHTPKMVKTIQQRLSISSSSPVQVTPSSLYDPFKRNDTKRKSIGKSLTSIFRKQNGSNITNSGQGSTAPMATTSTVTATQSATREKSHTHETTLSTTTTKATAYNTNASDSTYSPTVAITRTTATAGSGGNSEPASLDSVSSLGAIANSSGTQRTRDLSVCAVILDEWLKELAAIAQQHFSILESGNI